MSLSPKLAIFDMDGLIFDTERLYMRFMKEAAKQFGYEITEEYYLKTLGINGDYFAQVTFDHFGQDYPFDEVQELSAKNFHEYANSRSLPVKKGVEELLTFLKSRNIACCVASSSNNQSVQTFLNNSGLLSCFSYISSGDMVAFTKPDPEIFQKCLHHFSCRPEDAFILEDSESGILAAHRANIPVICIPDMKYPDKTFADKAYAIVQDLTQVIPYLA